MSHWVMRGAAFMLLVVSVISFLLFQRIIQLPAILVGQPPPPPVVLPDSRTDRPLQALYQLQVQAARGGWTSDRLRLAGDLWRSMGDLTRAVAYWEAAAPDATVLRDRAQAYLDLQRWSDADDTLDHLLKLLPADSTDRPWAQFQLGLIRAAYNPTQALDLLRAAQPTYGATVTNLLPLLAGAADSTQVGIVLAKNNLWPYAELAFSQSSDGLALAYRGLARDMQSKDGSEQIAAAVALAPQNSQVRFLQGLHLRLAYDYAGSMRAMVQAVALDPENPALYAELGKAYQLNGDLVSAEHWLKFAVSLDSHFQPLLDSFYDDEKSALLSLGLVDEASLPFSTTPTPTEESTVQP